LYIFDENNEIDLHILDPIIADNSIIPSETQPQQPSPLIADYSKQELLLNIPPNSFPQDKFK
jgi:hypothetical protein